MKYKLLFGGVFLFFVLVWASGLVSAALGITPAIKEFEYRPGETIVVNFAIIADDPEKKLALFVVENELSEYVRLDKDELTGGGGFTAFITIPSDFDEPGLHSISIGAREVPEETEFLGTAVTVMGIVQIFFPYPGRYVEGSLNIPNGNVDEQIPIELLTINRGIETVNLDVRIEFSTSGKLVYTMPFEPAMLQTTEQRYFRKYLDTSGYEPGDYVATAVLSYGDVREVNKTFRIGSLHVDMINFTDELVKDGLQKFFINIESKWNDDIDRIFADVNFSNEEDSLSFRTPPADLTAWEIKALQGIVDTDELELGEYGVSIILDYAGQRTPYSGTLLIKRPVSKVLVISIVVALVVVVGLVVGLVIWKKRRKK